jgi:hypothetical protein
MAKCEGAETLLRAIIDNDEGADGASKREKWLAAQDAGYLQDLADSARILTTITERVLTAKGAS